MPRRVEPDDDVRRFNAVYLGPRGMTLPWAARYIAYGVGAALFITICLVKAIVPGLSIGTPPVWEIALTVLGTSIVMAAVDHDKPLGAVIANGRAMARVRKPADPRPRRVQPVTRGTRLTRKPLHEPASPFDD